LELSRTAVDTTLRRDTTAAKNLIIRNIGTGGPLVYTIDDFNGQTVDKPHGVRGDPSKLKFNIPPIHRTDRSLHPDQEEPTGLLLGDTIIVDPIGDLLFGTGADIRRVLATRTPTAVTFDFQFVNNINRDSTIILWSLDTDFNRNTGAHPGGFGFNDPMQNIGSEYDVLIDLPGFFSGLPRTFYIWLGSNNQPTGPPLFTGSVTAAGNMVSMTITLSTIGNDDGNMAVAGFAGHFHPTIGLTSLDYMPNVGHGTVGRNPFGDLSWLSLSRKAGTLGAGQADTVRVTFDTHGLDSGRVYTGVLFITSNDPDELEVLIPVTLRTLPITSVHEVNGVPTTIALAQNYPNPFNPATTIRYDVPVASHVTIKLYDVLGREVQTLVDEFVDAGYRQVVIDASALSSGLYFYRMQTRQKDGGQGGSFVSTKKAGVLK
jgi:hypothetical protein